MRKEQIENQLLLKEIEVPNGEKRCMLIGTEGIVCYRNGVTSSWEPYGDENFRIALVHNRWGFISYDKGD